MGFSHFSELCDPPVSQPSFTELVLVDLETRVVTKGELSEKEKNPGESE